MTEGRIFDIACLGEPMLELNEQQDGRYLPGFGGDVSNCAVAAARQGARVAMLTRLGSDSFGDSFMNMWAGEGIEAGWVIRDGAAPTGLYFVSHGPEGHRFTYRRAGSAASRMEPADVPGEAIAATRLLHVSGISQAISPSAADTVFAAIEAARAAGTLVSYDANLRLNLWPLERARAVIHAGMARCDIALPGIDDARQLTGLEQPDAMADFYLRLGARIVALTLGRDGVLVATQTQRALIQAHRVEAVDATGAGDTFDGAFLAELLRTDDAMAAARYANAAAALSTRGYGAVAPMPRRPEIEAFLASQPAA